MPARTRTDRPDARRPRDVDARAGAARTGAARPATGRRTAPPVDLDALVLGPVPARARVVGGLLVLAGLAGVVGAFLPYLEVGGRELGGATGPGVVVALLAPVASVLVGASLVRGRLPRAGLAYAAVAGALAVGQLLLTLYQGVASTARPAVEVIAGEKVLTSDVGVRPGWVLAVVSVALTVLAALLSGSAWGRTVMEDGGALDPVRPVLAGVGTVLGFATVLCFALPAADVPDTVVRDPSTGLETVVSGEGTQALLERPGLALLGGLLLAAAVVLTSGIAPSLRPRLAAVGGLAALAVGVLTAGLGGLRDAVASPDLVWTVPGAGLLACGVGYAVLTLLAWRLRRGWTAPPDGG